MKGDFTRFGFDSRLHHSRVLHQQGRVTLDSDSNEASAILLHHLRMLTRDLFGAAGGPADSGFSLSLDTSTQPAVLSLSPGHYYVGGILCENEQWTDYADQPDHTPAPAEEQSKGDALLAWLSQPTEGQAFWVYLDVWERHISWIEDDSIRETALGGPDTCTRAKVVWQVKALPWDEKNWGSPREAENACSVPLPSLPPLGSGRMAARVDAGIAYTDPCLISPDAAYRGTENHLYRVEVHRGGSAGGGASFKWSRENGSVATRWLGMAAGDAEGASLAVASTRGLAAGDWVELSHDALDLANQPGQLVRIAAIDGEALVVDAASIPGGVLMAWSESLGNPKLRRWDQRSSDLVALDEGAVPVVESAATAAWTWLDLEDGLQVAFETGGTYRTGDYWVIPARVATQGILWPQEDGQPALQAAQGIVHAYAPLGVINLDGQLGVRPCRSCAGLSGTTCDMPTRPTRPAQDRDNVPTRGGTRPKAAVAANTTRRQVKGRKTG